MKGGKKMKRKTQSPHIPQFKTFTKKKSAKTWPKTSRSGTIKSSTSNSAKPLKTDYLYSYLFFATFPTLHCASPETFKFIIKHPFP
jgi:hypothetical protein